MTSPDRSMWDPRMIGMERALGPTATPLSARRYLPDGLPKPAQLHPMRCAAPDPYQLVGDHGHTCIHPAKQPFQLEGTPMHECWCGVQWSTGIKPEPTEPTEPSEADKLREQLACASNSLTLLLIAVDRLDTAVTKPDATGSMAQAAVHRRIVQLRQRAADIRASLDAVGLGHIHQAKEAGEPPQPDKPVPPYQMWANGEEVVRVEDSDAWSDRLYVNASKAHLDVRHVRQLAAILTAWADAREVTAP